MRHAEETLIAERRIRRRWIQVKGRLGVEYLKHTTRTDTVPPPKRLLGPPACDLSEEHKMATDQNPTVVYVGWDGQPHNHTARMLDLVRQQPVGSGDHHVKILHDDWCGFFKGRACNCDPDVREMLPWEIVGS